MTQLTVNQRLSKLRELMQAHSITACIVPSGDPHQSEYVAEHWKSREWISGFTGSMGYAVVTATEAHVWTDSRYFLQAEQELANTGFVLKKQGVQGAPEHVDWLLETLPSGSVVACDGTVFSASEIRQMKRRFTVKNIAIKTDIDFIDAIWDNRPSLPKSLVFEHDLTFAGVSRAKKLEAVRQVMQKIGASHHIIVTLDDIAWLLNVRASGDVECNPVVISYLLIAENETIWYIDEAKVSDELKNILLQDNIFTKSYTAISEDLAHLPPSVTLLLDPSAVNFKLLESIAQAKILEGNTPSSAMKAIKNETEIKYIRQVMAKDAVALLRAFRWLEKQLAENQVVTEYDLSAYLANCRAQLPLYVNESFPAIIGFGANGAIVHYRPMPETSAIIKNGDGNILLVDSGGQYQDGTTDITRTIALGEPTAEQRRNATLVLKGHIALAMLQFPHGTRGVQMDILARAPLWSQGLNYGHGTGHGVGFFLNVHEPPQGFTPTLAQRGTTVMEAGMFTSNEPGFYKTGEYGIRIENLVIARNTQKNDFGQFMDFETVTLFPIDRRLIEKSLLTEGELSWLNVYHQHVFESVSPLLDAEEQAWLKAQCGEI